MDTVGGKVSRVVGPVIEAEEVSSLCMFDMVEVGEARLVGEVVRLKEDSAYIQVYEDTTSLKAGDIIYTKGFPVYVELGPGLIGNVYDGIQRPLEILRDKEGYFMKKGLHLPSLDMSRRWHFSPLVKVGMDVGPGDIVGEIQETELIKHKVMIPPDKRGSLIWLASEGDYSLEEKIAIIKTDKGEVEIFIFQRWPVRRPRPYLERLIKKEPLVTGQRVIDTLFPVIKGGCVAVPGGFGTGKTVVQHQLAKWSDADIVIFVGCGERGNEMTDILLNFPRLIDPHTKRPLLERTIFIANTSNMPVAAREASIYTGITIAEYYRDMGYNVALMADSTSRWAEALRELSGRLEEMPLEEGFPAYLPSRLAGFYERAGSVRNLNGTCGSITIIASISPPAGDFSEPVTSHTKRFVRCFWALDRDLANSRHYPSISWTDSYSEYIDDVKDWFCVHIGEEWASLRYTIMELLQKEQRLLQVVKLVGADVLPSRERLILETCNIFKNIFLQQNAFEEGDTYCSLKRQFLIVKAVIAFYRKAEMLIKKGVNISEIKNTPGYKELIQIRFRYLEDRLEELEHFSNTIEELIDVEVQYK